MRIELVYEMGLDTVAVVTPETYEERIRLSGTNAHFSRTSPMLKGSQKTRRIWNTEDYSPIEETASATFKPSFHLFTSMWTGLPTATSGGS